MLRIKVFLSLTLMMAVGAHAQCAAACLGADSGVSTQAMAPNQSCHEETDAAPEPTGNSPSHTPNACGAGSLTEGKARLELKPLLVEFAVFRPVELTLILSDPPILVFRLETPQLDSAVKPSQILRI